jgi:hypothetical protein
MQFNVHVFVQKPKLRQIDNAGKEWSNGMCSAAKKKGERERERELSTLDCACESTAVGVLEDNGEVGTAEHVGVAVDVVDGELDGGPGGPSDDGIEGEEGADCDVGRARRLQGDWQHGA